MTPQATTQTDAAPVLTISRWDDVFETAASRKLVRLQYVNTPSGVDSAGYLELTTGHGVAGVVALGIFTALCQLTATWPRERRGRFEKTNGLPMSLAQIAALIRVELPIVEEAVTLLADDAVGWLVWESANHPPIIRQVSGGNIPPQREKREDSKEGKEERDGARAGATLAPAVIAKIEEIVRAYPKRQGEVEAQRTLAERHLAGEDLEAILTRTRAIAAVIATRSEADRLRILAAHRFFADHRDLDDPETYRSAKTLEGPAKGKTTIEHYDRVDDWGEDAARLAPLAGSQAAEV